MAKIDSITLRNFKGIGEVTIDFSKKGAPPVCTLIGLNESGKTTILEGLSHFVTGDSAVSSLFDGIHSKAEINSLIPVNKKAAFTGTIEVSADISVDEHDYLKSADIAKEHGLELNHEHFLRSFKVTRKYKFADSSHEETTNIWDFSISVKKPRAHTFKTYKRPPKDADESDLWLEVVNALQLRLPRVAYFPTFLVDLPKKIYLAQHKDERPVNKYYRNVFQDILDSLGEGLNLEKHVVERINDFRTSDNTPNWFSALFGGPSRSPIDSVFSKLSNAVTKEVLGSWQKVFQRKISAKNISIEWGIDAQNNNLPYAVISIFDGESKYNISDRSLGFRWFFSFLLFTAFKQKAKRATIFVFDEPAANLHARAQAELLKSFTRTVSGGDSIVYSTHSHHMISPKWISGAYIVENKALDYDSDDDTFGLSSKATDIVVTPYRHFVAQYPGRTSYFQPVIETLEYVVPAILGSAPFVIVEGITDYYALKLIERLSGKQLPFSIIPSVGAGASGPQISILLGRGETFVVLLDDDSAGRVAAKRYREEWFLDDTKVITLADVNPDFKGYRLERMIGEETRKIIETYAGLQKSPDKKQIGLYLAEMYASDKDKSCIGSQTFERFSALLTSLAKFVLAG